jgi:uncharacterized protein (DUF1015 family)
MQPGAVVTPPYVGSPLRLEPFRALRLSPRRIGDPAARRLLNRPYRAVTERLAQWQDGGQLSQDGQSALYLHEYSTGGMTVRGVVGALDVSTRAVGPEDRAVLPHEGIHPGQADSLADRMSQLGLNPAPILLVHSGSPEIRGVLDTVAARTPAAEFADRAGQQHRLWPIRDAAELAIIADRLADRTAVIADGHHRYAAYLRMQARRPGGAADRGLAMLVDQSDTPLFVGPIHRILEGVGLEDLGVAASAAGGVLTLTERAEAMAALDAQTLVVTDAESWGSLKVPLGEDEAAVEMLHRALIPGLPRGPARLRYAHTMDSALTAQRRSGGVVVLMPAPSVESVITVARAGRLFPEKATSFQPKPSAGVLIRSLRDG